jgi:hypothetical protein
MVSYLIERGVPINVRDIHGATAVVCAVAFNNYDAARLLLEAEANYFTPEGDGDTILHEAARAGGLEMLKVLTDHGLPGFDVDAKNNMGITAAEAFTQRLNPTDEVKEAFRELLDVVRWGHSRRGARGYEIRTEKGLNRHPERYHDENSSEDAEVQHVEEAASSSDEEYDDPSDVFHDAVEEIS